MGINIFFGIITSVFSLIATMFLGDIIFKSGVLGSVAFLIALLIGTVVGCTMAIIDTIKTSK